MTLYRKYRPQFFKDLIGQEHVKTTLENEIKQDKIAHAYLFTGSRGIGKTTLARLLAKALDCQQRKKGQAEPCNKCLVCQEINHGHFLDLIEIDAASNRGINEIRELRERVKFVPSQGKYKIFIIDESHMLTAEAFNALLKTLEEPPKHAIFILATTESHKLPETIISRCQRFDFKKIDPEEIAKRLEKISKAEGVKIEKEVLKDISYHCQGSSRDAESLLGQVLSLGEKKIGLEQLEIVLPRSDIKLVIELVEHLVKQEASDSLVLINRLIEEGVDLEQFTNDLIEFLRKILIFKVNRSEKTQSPTSIGLRIDAEEEYRRFNLDKEVSKKLQSLSQELETGQLIKIIELFIEKKAQLKWSEIPQLPLELAVVEIVNYESRRYANDSDELGIMNYEKEKERNVEIKTQKHEKVRVEEQPSRSSKIRDKVEPKLKSIKQKNKKIKKQSSKNNSEEIVTLDQIQSKWKEFLIEIKKKNHSLSAFLKMGRIVSWEDGILSLGFPFKFHQEKIKDNKNRKIAEEFLSQVLGIEKIEIKPVVETREEGILGKIKGVFGGKIEEDTSISS